MAARYLLAFLDRSNIGNARVAGLQKDLKMTDIQYQTGMYFQRFNITSLAKTKLSYSNYCDIYSLHGCRITFNTDVQESGPKEVASSHGFTLGTSQHLPVPGYFLQRAPCLSFLHWTLRRRSLPRNCTLPH